MYPIMEDIIILKIYGLHKDFFGGRNMVNALESISSVVEILNLLPAEEMQHMKRVGILVDCFTEKLLLYDLYNECLETHKHFGRAAFYHDIGKVWIPNSILTKPDRLTKSERIIICDHPLYAQKLFAQIRQGFISGIPEYLFQLAMDSSLYHHEWWNGNGYPYGIKRYEIPLIARITSICDAFDAMTSTRIYCKSHSYEYACQELKKCAGTQFDPELVSAFLLMRPDTAFYFNA